MSDFRNNGGTPGVIAMDAGRGLAIWQPGWPMRASGRKHIRDGTGRQALVMRYPLRSRLRGCFKRQWRTTDAKPSLLATLS